MSNTVVAKRYALALFRIAKEQQILGVVEEELRVVQEVMHNSDMKAVLKSSKLSLEKKKEILKNAMRTQSIGNFSCQSAYLLTFN